MAVILAIAVYLRDLTFIIEGNPPRVSDDAINFERLRLFARSIHQLNIGAEAGTAFHFEYDTSLSKYLLDVRWSMRTAQSAANKACQISAFW